MRAKNKETLMSLINSDSIDEAAKQKAIQDMIDLTEVSEKENAAETLLMAKGFSDPVVSITKDKVDVVINAPSITDPQRAQIEDIISRKAGIAPENIVITPIRSDKAGTEQGGEGETQQNTGDNAQEKTGEETQEKK